MIVDESCVYEKRLIDISSSNMCNIKWSVQCVGFSTIAA